MIERDGVCISYFFKFQWMWQRDGGRTLHQTQGPCCHSDALLSTQEIPGKSEYPLREEGVEIEPPISHCINGCDSQNCNLFSMSNRIVFMWNPCVKFLYSCLSYDIKCIIFISMISLQRSWIVQRMDHFLIILSNILFLYLYRTIFWHSV